MTRDCISFPGSICPEGTQICKAKGCLYERNDKQDMKTALVIPVYNRPEYVAQCFESLITLTTKPDILIIVDDASAIAPDTSILKGHFKSIIHIGNEKNIGVRQSLMKGIDEAFKDKDVYYVINLDSDAIVKPDFIAHMHTLHYAVGAHECIVSGFNCDSSTNKPIRSNVAWDSKPFCNGINMCFNKVQYQKYISPSLLKEGNWDQETSFACQKDNLQFLISKPSVVQHIGMISSMGHNHQEPDRANDFKMLSLPNVTLFGLDTRYIDAINRAATISQRDIEFGAVKIITNEAIVMPGRGTESMSALIIKSKEDYSRFMMKELNNYITTSHVLVIQHDGYVLNWKSWDNDWLQYDYIGATWWYKDNMNVGNGGFSLRSKKLQHILATNDIDFIHPEDHHICRTYRRSLEDNFGIKFAPEEVANLFAIEGHNTPDNAYNGQFGFHGFNVDFKESDIPAFLQPKQQTSGLITIPHRVIKRAPVKR